MTLESIHTDESKVSPYIVDNPNSGVNYDVKETDDAPKSETKNDKEAISNKKTQPKPSSDARRDTASICLVVTLLLQTTVVIFL